VVKEKNLLIIFISAFVFTSNAFGLTVCTTYEGKRFCGHSLVVDTNADSFSSCTNKTEKCKRLVITNSHLASGPKVEVCNEKMRCTVIHPKTVFNNVMDDLAVFEIKKSPESSTNAIIFRVSPTKTKLYSYHRTEDEKVLNGFGNQELFLKKAGERSGLMAPSWLGKSVTGKDEHGIWENENSSFVNLIFPSGTSGSPFFVIKDESADGIINEVQGVVKNHHNFLPISSFANENQITLIADQYLEGKRGLDEKSEKVEAKWHLASDGKTTYRSLQKGKIHETGALRKSSGGSLATDSGGSLATDSGGSLATDSGGSLATDSGDYCGPDEDSVLLHTINHTFALYPGVIIDDKRVLGFIEIETGRIVHANWELLTNEDIMLGKYKKFRPYFEDNYSAQQLIKSNRPSLLSGEPEKYCLENSKCIELQLNGSVLSITSSSGQKTVLNLTNLNSTDLFKNWPVKFSSTESSSIWLADIFLPDRNMDPLRGNTESIIGGNHSSGSIDLFKKI
jgi:hypothetical protein